MNMNNDLHIKTVVLLKVLDKSITTNMKYYNRLSNKIISTQINIFNM
jgi:hypothetical protein